MTLTAQEASSDPDRDALRDEAIAQQEAMLDVRAAGPEIRAVDPTLQSELDDYVAERVVAEPTLLVEERSAEEPQPEPEPEPEPEPAPEPEPEPEVTAADTEEETAATSSVHQSGTASWYGPGFEGNTTANGETYDPSQLTAAHRELPFGTLVRVTNQNNGQSVTVRINDRGPYAGNRIIDLSEAAASQIGMRSSGVAPVTIEIVG